MRPALLVFTLGPEVEARRRRLLPQIFGGSDFPLELNLHRACLESILAVGQEVGCELFVCSPDSISLTPGPTSATVHLPQADGSFGRRIEQAIGDLRHQLGDERPILLVGTDAPDLAAHHLQTALDALARDPAAAAVGASPDGGFYLLAFRGSLDLAGIRWRGPSTRVDLERRLRRSGLRVVPLAPLGDLDHASDLESWIARTRRRASTHSITRRFRALIAALASLLAERARPLSLIPLPVRSAQPAARPWSRPPPR